MALYEDFPDLAAALKARGEIVTQIPKVSRIRDRAALAKCRAKNRCENPSCRKIANTKWNPIDPHHVKTRGSGGGDTEDNLMALCRECHNLIHRDPEFKAAMQMIAERRRL